MSSESLTQKWLRQNVVSYDDKDRVFADIDAVLTRLPTLRPKSDVYTYDDGRTQLLLCIHGLLPISYRRASYNIPVAIWIQRGYPRQSPIAYVVPTHDMLVKPGRNVDANGRCQMEYLQHWERKGEAFHLTGLVQAMQEVFSREPPVYAKPKPPSAAAARATPSPAGGSPDYAGRPPPPVPSTSSLPSVTVAAASNERPGLPPKPSTPAGPLPFQNAAHLASRPPPPVPQYVGSPAYNHPATPPTSNVTSPTIPPTVRDNSNSVSDPRFWTPQPPPPPPPPPAPPAHAIAAPAYQPSPPNVLSTQAPYAPAVSPPVASGSLPYTVHGSNNTMPHPYTPNHQLAASSSPPPAPALGGLSPPPAHPPAHSLLDDDDDDTNNSHIDPSKVVTAAAVPPRPPNPELLRLHAAVHAKIQNELATLTHAMSADAERLRAHQADLLAGVPLIQDERARLEAVRDVCRTVSGRLADNVSHAERNVAELRRKGEPDVDELVCSTSIVHNQMINLVAEDNAIEDTIYHLHRALSTGRIDLERFLRTTRVLAEEQFMKRALMEKIQQGLAGGLASSYSMGGPG